MPSFVDAPNFAYAGGTSGSYGVPAVPLLGVPAGLVPDSGYGGKYTSGFSPSWLYPGMLPGNWDQRVMPWHGPKPGLSGMACAVPGMSGLGMELDKSAIACQSLQERVEQARAQFQLAQQQAAGCQGQAQVPQLSPQQQFAIRASQQSVALQNQLAQQAATQQAAKDAAAAARQAQHPSIYWSQTVPNTGGWGMGAVAPQSGMPSIYDSNTNTASAQGGSGYGYGGTSTVTIQGPPPALSGDAGMAAIGLAGLGLFGGLLYMASKK